MRTSASKVLALFVIALCGCISQYHSGRTDARRDITRGTLGLEAYGTPDGAYWEYEQLLKERYGITVTWVSDQEISDRALEHWRGYNEVARTEIERRFGTNVLERTKAEAKELYEKKRAKPAPKN